MIGATSWPLELRILLGAGRFVTLPTLRTLRVGVSVEACGD